MAIYKLSKSTIIKGKQCEKALWLKKHKPFLRDPLSKTLQSIFRRGNDVGKKAQRLFPGGLNIRSMKSFSMEKAVKETQKAIEKGIETIYEATFIYNEVLIMADILHKSNGKWYIYEVKSSVKISATYVYDAAIQYYVLEGNNLPIDDFFISNINKNYLYDGKLDIQQLFKHHSVLNEIRELQLDIKKQVERLSQIVDQEKMPEIAVGKHCFNPYRCDFIGTCWKGIPKENEQEHPKNDKLKINKDAISHFKSKIKYPVALFDVEAFMPAIPIFKGTHPYQHLPFAFVLYVLKNSETQPEIFRFIANPGMNPELEINKALRKALENVQSIIAYDDLLEKKIINKAFDGKGKGIKTALKENIIDISTLFKKGHISILNRKSKSSLKSVIQFIDTDIKYDDLNIVNGRMAQVEYEQLQYSTDMFLIQEKLDELVKYCEKDVNALMHVFKFVMNDLAIPTE